MERAAVRVIVVVVVVVYTYQCPHLSFCLLQKSLRILSTMDERGRMLVLFFFLVSLVSTTMMTQSAEPWVRRLLCQRVMSSFAALLYASVSCGEAEQRAVSGIKEQRGEDGEHSRHRSADAGRIKL